jgi:hypothetical protein
VQTGGACTASPDCASGLYCSAATQHCVSAGTSGSGATCATDGDCAVGLRCDYVGFTGRCEPAGTGDLGQNCGTQKDCIAGLFCGASGMCEAYATAFPPFAGVTCPADTGPFHAYFEVPRPSPAPDLADFFRLPYPNDIRVSAPTGGTLDIHDFPEPGPTAAGGVDIVKLYKDTLVADFDGFASTAPITFRFSKPIDCSSGCATLAANIHLVDTLGGAVPGLSFFFTPVQTNYSCANRLTIIPATGTPFTPGHTYALYITNGVRSTTGDTPAQDPDLGAVLAASNPGGALSRAWTVMAPVRTAVGAANVGTVSTAAVFTIATMEAHMQRLSNAVAARPAPTVSGLEVCGVSTTPSNCDSIDAAHACPATMSTDFYEIHGRITLPIYQTGTEPYLTPGDGGGIVENVSGVPQWVRDEQVCFAMTIPRPVQANYQLVVYGHGTGGNMRDFINEGIADKLATGTNKIAAFSFDAVEHGDRHGTSPANPEDLVFNVLNPRAARDNFMQGAADILTALRLPGTDFSSTGLTFAIISTRNALFGHSQGSTSGEIALPFWNVTNGAAVLSGAGSSLTQSLLHKTSPSNYLAGLTFLIGRRADGTVDNIDGSYPVMTLFQNFFDRADPVNYDRSIITVSPTHPKHVFMTWGTGDTYTPLQTLEANALTLGIPAHTPMLEDMTAFTGKTISGSVSANMTGGITGVMFQYAPPAGVDGHFVATQNTTAVDNWSAFLQTFVTTGTPTVP